MWTDVIELSLAVDFRVPVFLSQLEVEKVIAISFHKDLISILSIVVVLCVESIFICSN